MSHAKRKKTWILSMKYWLFQRDPYVMVVNYNPHIFWVIMGAFCWLNHGCLYNRDPYVMVYELIPT